MKQQKDQNVFYRCDFLQKMKPEFVEKKPTVFQKIESLYRMRTDVSSRKYKNFLLFEIYAEKTFKICNKETISNIRVRRMLLSCPAKKVTKECGQRGATKMRPLWKPQPQRHPTSENVPIFGSLPGKASGICIAGVQKSEHFWTLTDEAAQGFLKGGAPRSEYK